MELGVARHEDLPRLVELLGILFAQEADFAANAEKQRRGLEMILADPRIGRVFVARDGERVVAMASLLYTVSTAEGGKAALFEDLVVLPEYRRRGIASSLLRHIAQFARNEGVVRITLLTDRGNAKAQALYRRAGFEASGMLPMRLYPDRGTKDA